MLSPTRDCGQHEQLHGNIWLPKNSMVRLIDHSKHDGGKQVTKQAQRWISIESELMQKADALQPIPLSQY